MIKVYIDWGYGIGDAVINNYQIGEKVSKKLEMLGIQAVIRPEYEEHVCLEKRISEIQNSQAQILISIGSNWSENANQKGIETYYSDSCKTGDLLASKVQRELIKATNFYNRGIINCNHKTNAAIASLLHSNETTIVTLIGFSSNPYEWSQMEQDGFKELISDSILKGLSKYMTAKGIIM